MRNFISIADLTNDEIEEIFALADSAHNLRVRSAGERPDHGDALLRAEHAHPAVFRVRHAASGRLRDQLFGYEVLFRGQRRNAWPTPLKSYPAYADVLVVRHYWDGAVQAMAEHADVPVINAGDGGHEHPTQTLCDLYTLRKEKGELKGLTVVVCGDLKNGRTIHSLVFALARFGANVVTLGGQRHGVAAIRSRALGEGIRLRAWRRWRPTT